MSNESTHITKMSDELLENMLETYERMKSTGLRPNGDPASIEDLRLIGDELAAMKAESETRKISKGIGSRND